MEHTESHKEHEPVHENRHEDAMQDHSAKENIITRPILVLAILLLVAVVFNQFQLSSISNGAGSSTGIVDAARVIPTGIPDVYGQEIGVSYDDVSPSDARKADAVIRKISVFDNQITLTGNDLQRYIAAVSQISCEYCCGAESIIFSNGQAACGCAHSAAMRGLAKYLIKNHGTEYTNDEVLEELGKWKTLFFPGMLAKKALVLKEKGIELNYINLASNKYRDIEKGAAITSDGTTGGGMVGGC